MISATSKGAQLSSLDCVRMTRTKRDFECVGWSDVKDWQCANVDPCERSTLLWRRGTPLPGKERRRLHPDLMSYRLTLPTTPAAALESRKSPDGLSPLCGEKNLWPEWRSVVLDM